MKKLLILVAAFALVGIVVNPALAKKPEGEKPGNEKCTTIQSGELYSSTGEVLTTGFDEFGYNYQAHQYLGYYGNYQRPALLVDWGARLMMKWNDAWLSNKDCDGDTLLDRHLGFDTYIGSGAWLTNHEQGTYTEEGSGKVCDYNYFVKIISPPTDAESVDGFWYTADGVEIGEVIWGQFAIIQEINKDSCGGSHYQSDVRSGLGNW